MKVRWGLITAIAFGVLLGLYLAQWLECGFECYTEFQ
jgi:hypothetical protein